MGYECCLAMSELLGIFVKSCRNLGVDIVGMVQVALDECGMEISPVTHPSLEHATDDAIYGH